MWSGGGLCAWGDGMKEEGGGAFSGMGGVDVSDNHNGDL